MDERQKLEALGVIQLNVASSEQPDQRTLGPSKISIPGEDNADAQGHRRVPRSATVTTEEEEERLSSPVVVNQPKKDSSPTVQPKSRIPPDGAKMQRSSSSNSNTSTTKPQQSVDGRNGARPPSRDRWGMMDQHTQPGFPPHLPSRPFPFDPQMAYAAGNRHSWHEMPHVPLGAATSPSTVPSTQYSNVFSPAPRPEVGSFRSWSPVPATPYPPPTGPPSSSHGYIKFQNSAPMGISPTFSHTSLNSQPRPPAAPISPTMSSNFGHPPRVLGGYPLLAEKLAGVVDGDPVVPMYRSFAALNHRLLLYLQDDLVCLESELRNLEAAETDARNGPASRRQETRNAPETYNRKQELLGKIRVELCRYNQLMASFRKTRGFLIPSPVEIQTYRSFLARSNSIVEEETRFLNHVDDLVCLDTEPEAAGQPVMDGDRTPMPERKEANGYPFRPGPPGANSPRTGRPPPQRRTEPQPNQVAELVLAVVAAVVLPLLLFVLVPGFVARLIIVVFAGASFVVGSLQTGLFKLLVRHGDMSDAAMYLGAYGGVMALLAGTIR